MRLIGSTWKDSKNRTWEVLEMARPGFYRVGVMVSTPTGGRVAVRLGEMQAKAIREAVKRSP